MSHSRRNRSAPGLYPPKNVAADAAAATTPTATGPGPRNRRAASIRLDLDCADICATSKRVLSRQTEYDANVTRALVQACVQSCKSCGDECEQHAQHVMQPCRMCAEACRRWEQACTRLLDAVSS